MKKVSEKINEYEVGVVGLGYVGLTLATMLADVGVKVMGVEKRQAVVDDLNKCKPHFVENGLDVVLRNSIKSENLRCFNKFTDNTSCKIYIITVGTPLDNDGNARIDMIEHASNEVAEHMPEGALVIVRSTVKIGTTRNIVKPILESSGKSFSLAMCPERTLEGNALRELRTIPQIIGADDDHTLDLAEKLFQKLTKTTIRVNKFEAAEILKLVDNTYRDVQFAFANEVARACEAFGVNSFEVISSGKLGYGRTNVALPGLVGGPCLEKDPHIFQQSVNDKIGIDLEITKAARLVNERQPKETVEFIVRNMKERGLSSSDKITVLGIAFKGYPETDDLRGAMSLKVIQELKKQLPNLDLNIFDPIVKKEDLKDVLPEAKIHDCISEATTDASVILITNNHYKFRDMAFDDLISPLKNKGFIFDYWNNFSHLNKETVKKTYFAVGNI